MSEETPSSLLATQPIDIRALLEEQQEWGES